MAFDSGLKQRDVAMMLWISISTTLHRASVRLDASLVPTLPLLVTHIDYLGPVFRCCDNCNPVDKPTVLVSTQRPSTPIQTPHHTSPPCTPSSTTNAAGKRPMAQDVSAVTRRAGQHLQDVRQALEHWHIQTCRRDYPHCSFTATTIMLDRTLTTLASNRSLKTEDDLKNGLSPLWDFADEYAAEVLRLLVRLDANTETERLCSEVEKQARKRQVQEEERHRKAIAKMERQVVRANASIQAMAVKENILSSLTDHNDSRYGIQFILLDYQTHNEVVAIMHHLRPPNPPSAAAHFRSFQPSHYHVHHSSLPILLSQRFRPMALFNLPQQL